VGTANETATVTDVASQAPNMMSFIDNLKVASQASVKSAARSPLEFNASRISAIIPNLSP
jgi:hypothetical protein